MIRQNEEQICVFWSLKSGKICHTAQTKLHFKNKLSVQHFMP